ncbi:DUF7718 family protein [Candidatus Kuenenia stuttgartensis]|uniref:DUF7718 domain-containing protein n=1 Tax=Kuenenia stuttgartiensis TaxID=174633 RepID=Q1PVV0_KUEST|nr:unknown protein [Candidatus Kuenenia stuttgartiensis]
MRHERGKIVFFRVPYKTRINDKWCPVVRYDTAHGFVHKRFDEYQWRCKENTFI